MTLRKLIAAVEAGTATGGPDAMFVPRDMSELIEAVTGSDDDLWSAFAGAHDGSLDDAKALHEALLPGWHYRITRGKHTPEAIVQRDLLAGEHASAELDCPARAWLLAILKALKS